MHHKDLHKKFASLLEDLTSSPEHCSELADPDLYRQLPGKSYILDTLRTRCKLPEPVVALTKFKSWLGSQPSLDPLVVAALRVAQAGKAATESAKYDLLRALMLNPNNAATQQKIQELRDSIPVHLVQSFPVESAYPPVDEWIVESEEIDRIWRGHIETGKLPDRRNPRYPMHRVDPSHLSFDLKPDCSAVFKDATTGEVIMVVMRDFCRDKATLDWITEVVLENIEVERNIRVRLPFKILPPKLMGTLLCRRKIVAAW